MEGSWRHPSPRTLLRNRPERTGDAASLRAAAGSSRATEASPAGPRAHSRDDRAQRDQSGRPDCFEVRPCNGLPLWGLTAFRKRPGAAPRKRVPLILLTSSIFISSYIHSDAMHRRLCGAVRDDHRAGSRQHARGNRKGRGVSRVRRQQFHQRHRVLRRRRDDADLKGVFVKKTTSVCASVWRRRDVDRL